MMGQPMSKRVALIDKGLVANVAEFPDDWTGDVWDGHTAIIIGADDALVGPGWSHDGSTFTPPPEHTLSVDQAVITPTGSALVTYRNTYDDAPVEITFDVNGATSTVALTDGTAELEITPSGTGRIVVTVDQPLPSIAITVEEA
jgi:hypothetical protein